MFDQSPRKCGYSKCPIMFTPTRKHQKYCCPNHQVYAFREHQKIEKQKADAERETRLKNWAGQLKRIAPRTARGLDEFFSRYDADPVCREMAVKLALTVVHEMTTKKSA